MIFDRLEFIWIESTTLDPREWNGQRFSTDVTCLWTGELEVCGLVNCENTCRPIRAQKREHTITKPYILCSDMLTAARLSNVERESARDKHYHPQVDLPLTKQTPHIYTLSTFISLLIVTTSNETYRNFRYLPFKMLEIFFDILFITLQCDMYTIQKLYAMFGQLHASYNIPTAR